MCRLSCETRARSVSFFTLRLCISTQLFCDDSQCVIENILFVCRSDVRLCVKRQTNCKLEHVEMWEETADDDGNNKISYFFFHFLWHCQEIITAAYRVIFFLFPLFMTWNHMNDLVYCFLWTINEFAFKGEVEEIMPRCFLARNENCVACITYSQGHIDIFADLFIAIFLLVHRCS